MPTYENYKEVSKIDKQIQQHKRKGPKNLTESALTAFDKRLKFLTNKLLKAKDKYEKNPSSLLKSGEWTPAHAVRIVGGKLQILTERRK